jgi:tetratricopeptide (TPR) repeat protein
LFEGPIIELTTRAGELGIPYQAEQVKTGLSILFLLLLIPVMIAFFFVLRFIYRITIGEKMKTTLLDDYKKEAEAFEKAGNYVSAADIHGSRLRDIRKAAALYERGRDYRKAAELYDLLGEAVKAREMYEKDGNAEDSAGVSMREGDFEEAARTYDKAGMKEDAALVLERAGRRLAAVRAYREAGDFRNASRLLETEGMMKEASEMFGLSLRGKRLDVSVIQDFYTYAFKLEKSGQTDKAMEVYRKIDQADPLYRDVRERLHSLTSAKEKENRSGETTIRHFIRNGSKDPRNSLKLWVQILRNLQTAYDKGRSFGLLSPENILIEDQNVISFLGRTPSSVYVAPEIAKGLEPDARSDIYSMGVILYEMITGSLEGFGSTRVADHVHDLPDWLDEMVTCCIRKVREDRYQSIEAIFDDIKKLSKAKRNSGDSA